MTSQQKQIYTVRVSTLGKEIKVEAYTMYEALEKARDIEQKELKKND